MHAYIYIYGYKNIKPHKVIYVYTYIHIYTMYREMNK